MTQQILGNRKRARYDESLIDKVNAQYADLPIGSPTNLEPFYEEIVKKPNESYAVWDTRIQKLELQIKEWPNIRYVNGEDKTRVWEVEPGRYGFHVDHDEIQRELAEEKLLDKIDELREEYAKEVQK